MKMINPPKQLTAWEIRKNTMSDDRKKQIEQFLNSISQVESSGGKNFDHDEIKQGMHQGHRAIGRYGLMPNTVKEVANRMRREGLINPNIRDVSSMEAADMKSTLETNPAYEQELAEYLANHVLNKQAGDDEKAAYSWFQGHNLSPERINESNYKEHDYVKKYNKFKNIKKLLGGNESE